MVSSDKCEKFAVKQGGGRFTSYVCENFVVHFYFVLLSSKALGTCSSISFILCGGDRRS